MGVHFKSPDPVVRDGVVVLGAAEPGVCVALGLVGVRDRGDLGYAFEELLYYYHLRNRCLCGGRRTLSRFGGEAQLERGAMMYMTEIINCSYNSYRNL